MQPALPEIKAGLQPRGKGTAMSKVDAAPVQKTIADGEVLTESHQLMVGHREEAQRILDRELKAGMPPRSALAMAARAIKAASRARVMHLAELPYATTA